MNEMMGTPVLSEHMIDSLLVQAEEAMLSSYSPYSQFAVGAALLCEGDAVIRGANVENASYGLTVCAERVAVWQAVMEKHVKKKQPWRAIALLAKNNPNGSVAPCGACLQVLSEFASDESVVITRHAETGEPQVGRFIDMFPAAFSL